MAKVPSLNKENEAKLTLMEISKCDIEFEECEGSWWSLTLFLNDSTILDGCRFNAPTADECVADAFQYFLGRNDAESQMVALRS